MDNLSRRLVSAQQSEAGSAAETEPVTAQRSAAETDGKLE